MFASLGEETTQAVVPVASQVPSQAVPLYSSPYLLIGGAIAVYLLYQYFYGEE